MNAEQLQQTAIETIQAARAWREKVLSGDNPFEEVDTIDAAERLDPQKALVAVPLAGLRLCLSSVPKGARDDANYRALCRGVSGTIPDVSKVHLQACDILHLCQLLNGHSSEADTAGDD